MARQKTYAEHMRRRFHYVKKSKKFRKFLSEQQIKQGGRCFYCKIFLLDSYRFNYLIFGIDCYEIRPQWSYVVDHVIPLAAGGTNSYDNLVLACSDCNCRKGSKLEWQL